MFDSLFGLVSYDLGIDLGTTHTFVLIKGKGIMIREPSVVARQQKSKQILAIGEEAKKMLGKTPKNIEAFYPLRNGVIADFDATQAMLEYYIRKVHETPGWIPKIPKPKVVIGVPSGVTEVERRAVQEAALSAGARRAYLIEEPIAAAIGARLPIQEATGNIIVDIGGGTTEIAVISLGGVVVAKSLRIAGDKMNQDIIRYIRNNYQLAIGERTAEDIKIKIGSASHLSEKLELQIRGRDIITGLPKEQIITDVDARKAIAQSIMTIVNTIKIAIEETPPELIGDIMERGIILAGGGALLRNLDKLVTNVTKVPCYISSDPLTAVVRGTGIILEDLDSLKEVLIPLDIGNRPKF